MPVPDEHLGPVRPYALTGGRTRPSRNTVRPETLLVATDDRALPMQATRQHRVLVRTCGRLLSVAEAAAYTQLPISVVLVLVCDLVDTGHLTIRTHAAPDGDGPSLDILERVLDGLRTL